MMDLFRSEMEVHSGTLSDGLLALEDDSGGGATPSRSEIIESLMRAAHSIKGGARIVELNAAVKLAHTMEDCFVAAQKGEIPLGSDDIDILLKGVDMLNQIAENAEEESTEWLSAHQKEIDDLVADVSSILSGTPLNKSANKKTVLSPAGPAENGLKQQYQANQLSSEQQQARDTAISVYTPPEPPTEPEPPPSQLSVVSPQTPAEQRKAESRIQKAEDTRQRSTDKDRMVRVTAGKIERLMALAGEVVVGSRWLPPFSESLLKLKKTNIELFNILEKMQEEPGTNQKLVPRAMEKARKANSYLLERLNQLDMFTSSSENLSDRLYHEIISVRMRPFADGIQVFPRMIRDLARELDKKVKFDIMGKNTEVDRDILEKLEAPLSHLLRNALDHGIETPEERVNADKPETGTLRLEAAHRSGMLMITVSDDGRGVDLDELRLKILEKGLTNAEMVGKLSEAELMEFLFLPGFSTLSSVTEISGRGVGLDVVHNMVHEVRGIVRAVSKPGKGLSFHLELPLTLSVVRTFVVEITKETYAFPLARIDRCLMLSDNDIETVEDRQYFRFGNKNISLVDIHDVLELEKPFLEKDRLAVIVVSDRVHAYGLVVDQFLGECDLVVRPLDQRLGKVSDISSMAIMLDGSPVLIFDVEDLVRSIDALLNGQKRLQKIGQSAEAAKEKKGKHILVVDDSITVREMERKLLMSKGYQVDVAVDGMEAWNLVRTNTYDMVVSDIDMPRMNGFELISHIKQNDNLKSLPVMVVSYKNKEEDRLRGLEAGANYYLTKSSFQDNSFIDAVVDLIGEAYD
ncbi:MAG: hybrid sensor histidine kinase/response regulator [Desulfobacterales bacterium]|nr:hybrid sensor histidine kinase/response regulator [Desulfobacterales bacterium]